MLWYLKPITNLYFKSDFTEIYVSTIFEIRKQVIVFFLVFCTFNVQNEYFIRNSNSTIKNNHIPTTRLIMIRKIKWIQTLGESIILISIEKSESKTDLIDLKREVIQYC